MTTKEVKGDCHCHKKAQKVTKKALRGTGVGSWMGSSQYRLVGGLIGYRASYWGFGEGGMCTC